jgi:uncharacterized membrane protein
MAAITVLKFNTAGGAEVALEVIQNLAKQHLITLQDAAIVTWPMGKKKPKTRQLSNLAGLGALDGAFWGMLFGLIFFVPLFGMAVGAAMGALAGSFTDVGIDDDFINSVQDKVTEGTSALFLMTSDVVMDKVTGAMKELDFELIASNLSREQEAQLKAAFAHE